MLEAAIHMCSKKKLFWKFQKFSGKQTDKMKYKTDYKNKCFSWNLVCISFEDFKAYY